MESRPPLCTRQKGKRVPSGGQWKSRRPVLRTFGGNLLSPSTSTKAVATTAAAAAAADAAACCLLLAATWTNDDGSMNMYSTVCMYQDPMRGSRKGKGKDVGPLHDRTPSVGGHRTVSSLVPYCLRSTILFVPRRHDTTQHEVTRNEDVSKAVWEGWDGISNLYRE